MPSSVLKGGASAPNCARKIAGPLIVFMASDLLRGATIEILGRAGQEAGILRPAGLFPDCGLPRCRRHFECPDESQTDSQQGELRQLCRCPGLSIVGRLVSLSAAGIVHRSAPRPSVPLEFGSVVGGTRPGDAFGAPVNDTVLGIFNLIAQPSSMACWATLGTMMLSWRDPQGYPIDTAMQKCGTDCVGWFNAHPVLD